MPSNAARSACSLVNQSGNGDPLYVFFGPAASGAWATSLKLADGQAMTCQDGSQISVSSPTKGDGFYAS